MKVLINGNDKEYEITCGNCNSDLSYQEDDIKVRQVEKADLNRVEYKERLFSSLKRSVTPYVAYDEHYVICPVCNSKIKINSWSDFLNGKRTRTEYGEWTKV